MQNEVSQKTCREHIFLNFIGNCTIQTYLLSDTHVFDGDGLYVSDYIVLKDVHIKKIISIVLFIGLGLSMNAQEVPLTIEADSIQILGKLFESDIIQTQYEDRQLLPFLESLDQQSFGAVRSGGPSVLTTLLHRGMASRHVAVLWNGFNIQSVVNGTYDIGLIPSSFDNTHFYSNGTSSVTGNASVAGALSLENKLKSESSLLMDVRVSNAQNLSTAITHKVGTSKYRHHLNASIISNKNRYDYRSGGIQLTQEYAAFNSWNLNYDCEYFLTQNLKLKGGLWVQEADRNLPPTKTSIDTSQTQVDENYRSFLGIDYYATDKLKFSIRAAVFEEVLDFRTVSITSIANTDVFSGAFDFSYGEALTISTQYRKDKVEATFFTEEFVRNTFSTVLDYRKSIKAWNVGLTIRPDVVDGAIQPLQLGIRIDRPLTTKISTSFRYNKGYTLPSFNDLFWPSGGNESLKTERSHEFDLGFSYKPNSKDDFSVDMNLFYSSIDDWIQWSPVEGLFEPSNQKKVRNLGVELKVKDEVELSSKHWMSYSLLYGFTDSRLAKDYLTSTNEGKRTIFVPAHKVSATIQYGYEAWKLYLSPIYYSRRYDTVDNSSYVPGFFLLDAELTRKLSFKKLDCLLSIGVENSLNNDYENIRFYPMPLRVISLGLKLKL